MGITTSSLARDMSPITERFHKTDIINELADTTSLNRKQVIDVLDELAVVIERHVIDGSVGEFILAGLFKVTTVKKEAKEIKNKYLTDGVSDLVKDNQLEITRYNLEFYVLCKSCKIN